MADDPTTDPATELIEAWKVIRDVAQLLGWPRALAAFAALFALVLPGARLRSTATRFAYAIAAVAIWGTFADWLASGVRRDAD